MALVVLENESVDVTNIDGAIFNNFTAGNRDGIIGGSENECGLSESGNNLIISTGLLLVRGVRIKLTDIETISFASTPQVNMRYRVVAQVTRNGDVFTPIIFADYVTNELQQDDIINNDGVYQMELGRFTHDTSGNVTDVIRTADILYAGLTSNDFDIGEVTATTLDSSFAPEVDIDKRIDNGKKVIDFKFAIPKGDPSTLDKLEAPSAIVDLSDLYTAGYGKIPEPLEINETTEISFSGLSLPAGKMKTFVLYIKRTADVSVTWPITAQNWKYGEIPLLPLGKTCEIYIKTFDGITFYGEDGGYYDV